MLKDRYYIGILADGNPGIVDDPEAVEYVRKDQTMTDAIEKAISKIQQFNDVLQDTGGSFTGTHQQYLFDAIQLLREHKAKQAEGVENTINKIMQEIKKNTFVDAYDMSVITGILRQALTQGDGNE